MNEPDAIEHSEIFGESNEKATILTRYRKSIRENLKAAGANPNTEAFETQAEMLAKQLSDLEVSALIDPGTGLYNRRGFNKRLEEEADAAGRADTPYTIVTVDLNRLKQVNDSEGHDVGDEYIKAAADLLSKTSRRSDVFGRVGGDEFAGILRTNLEGAMHWGARMVRNFSNADVGLSIGVALLDPQNPKASLKLSDERMYAAKEKAHESGGNYYFDGTATNVA